jgi:hypothetical protein
MSVSLIFDKLVQEPKSQAKIYLLWYENTSVVSAVVVSAAAAVVVSSVASGDSAFPFTAGTPASA